MTATLTLDLWLGSPHTSVIPFHRWQHFYLWPLYGFMAIKWQFLDDFLEVIRGRIGGIRFPRPKGKELAIFLGGKALYFTLAFGIPLLFHSPWAVLLFYGTAVLVVGMVLSIVFQLAHCVEQAEFPMPEEDTGRIENAWAIHQVETTVDFARRSRIVTWLLGGLNFQVEHHLFPRICRYLIYSGIQTCGGTLSRVWDHLQPTQVVVGGCGVPLPLVATHGNAGHGGMNRSVSGGD